MKMIRAYYKKFFLLFSLAMLMHGCIEPYEFETETYENVLVVEATLTDELKRQEVLLSRSFMVGEDAPVPQTGASVYISDDSGNEFIFREVSPGRYESVDALAAVEGRSYQLHITTNDGQYESGLTPLEESTGIDDLYARRTPYNGDDGVALLVDNFNSPDASRYYRYKYEETYKIISRLSWTYDLVYVNGAFAEVPKTKEETICYNTVISNDIILGSTRSQQENNLEGFLVRFIKRSNPIGSRRYSILLTQYAISPDAFAYYETVKKLSGSDNVFSQNQPGFVAGNVYNINDPGEKVVGMFNVSSVSTKRIYFNYSDYYEPREVPPHFTDPCDIGAPSIIPTPDNLVYFLEMGFVKYMGPSGLSGLDNGPYKVVNAACVDCTKLGTNEVPEFWEED